MMNDFDDFDLWPQCDELEDIYDDDNYDCYPRQYASTMYDDDDLDW